MIEPQIIGNFGFIFKLPIRVKSAISSSFFRVYTEKRNLSVVFPQSLLQSLVMDSILPEKLIIPPLSSQTFILYPTATQQRPNKWESAWPTASNHVLAKLCWVGVMLSYVFWQEAKDVYLLVPFLVPAWAGQLHKISSRGAFQPQPLSDCVMDNNFFLNSCFDTVSFPKQSVTLWHCHNAICMQWCYLLW